ncbi:MAG: response regulator, partial [Gemmatimonadetes bacterium]|nr:response regulator [Gemmatimonadota bacterium]
TQLLGFARKQIIRPRVLDLNDFLHIAERLLRRGIGEDVELRVEPAPGLWPVLGDAGQMEQVILNLASTARDAMPLGGTLAIETRNVPGDDPGADPTGAGDHVQLVVRDTGVGMTPAVLAHVFEPFYTTKEIGRGTGLGLATVYGIVEQNGGRIRAESAPGRGAVFTIELPRATGAPTASTSLPGTRPVTGGETVLVVEDERLVREVTERVLARNGYRVLAASNAAEALAAEASERGPIHLLLTDVVMPGRDGRALAEEIRRRRPTIAVLFVSGYSDEVISRRGGLEEGTSFLAKPYRPGELLQKVRGVLDRR